MEKRILIIGSEGFIGKYFINYYIKHYDAIEKLYMVDILEIKKKNYFKCNVTNFEKIKRIIQKIKPDEIYNFSGTFSNILEEDYLNNVIATRNIFESIIQNNNINCKILINGSAAEYGFIKKKDSIINEDYPLNPISFYGLSKVYQTFLAKTYFLRNNIKVYIARPFNIVGYGISQKLFIGRLINEIKLNLKNKSKIILGNLHNERDYLDIEDLVRAYEIIMNNSAPGEIYNIGSAESIKIKELLDIFLKVFKINKNEVEIDKNLIRKFDIPKIVADNSKLKRLNWEKKILLEDSVRKIKDLMFNEIYKNHN